MGSFSPVSRERRERRSFVLVPGNLTDDFENRGSERAGMLNVSAPGNFEESMPGITQWFVERPPAHSRV